MESTTSITLRLPRKLARAYGAIAAWHGMPRARLMHQVLEEHLAQDELAQTLLQLSDDDGKHNGGGRRKQSGKNGAQPKQQQVVQLET